MEKGKEKYVDTTSMTESTKEFVRKRKIRIRKPGGKKKYKAWERKMVIYEGYNCLENLTIVRKYIQRIYEIDFAILETLLFLFPKGLFTHVDYSALDKQFQIATIRRLITLGYAKVFSPSGKNTKTLYKLTKKSHVIVVDFYDTLLGDKPFNVVKAEKFFKLNQKGDSKTLEIIKKLDKKVSR